MLRFHKKVSCLSLFKVFGAGILLHCVCLHAQTRVLEATFIMQVPEVVDWIRGKLGPTPSYIPKRFFSPGVQIRGMFYVGNFLRLFAGMSFFYLYYETAIRKVNSWTLSFIPVGLGPTFRIKRLIQIQPYIQTEFFSYTPYVRIDHIHRRRYEPPYCVYYNITGTSPWAFGIDLTFPYREKHYISITFQRVFNSRVALENHYFPPARYVLGIGIHRKWKESKKVSQ